MINHILPAAAAASQITPPGARSGSFTPPTSSLRKHNLLLSSRRPFHTTRTMGRLTVDNINPHVVEAEYAVRGELAVKSEVFRAKLRKGDGQDLPFDEVISANIGNPQQLDQKPLTFFRQVLSILENPQLLEHEDVLLGALGYKSDVIARAKSLLDHVGSVGAYSASAGVPAIKESIAKFLESAYFTFSFIFLFFFL